MVWVRLDDHFDQNPKVASVGPLGIALWTVGLAYCNRNLTDGFIPWVTARSLLSWEYLDPPTAEGHRRIQRIGITSGMAGDDVGSDTVICLLLEAGLWEEVAGGYRIHDYSEFQPTRAEVEAEKAAKQAAGRAGGQAAAIARAKAAATAGAQAGAVAKSKPDPDPVPLTSTKQESAPLAAGTRSRKPKDEVPPLTAEEREKILGSFPDEPEPDTEIALAQKHESAKKYPTGQYLYVRKWFQRNRERREQNAAKAPAFRSNGYRDEPSCPPPKPENPTLPPANWRELMPKSHFDLLRDQALAADAAEKLA